MDEKSTKEGVKSASGTRKTLTIAVIIALVLASLCAIGVYVAKAGAVIVYDSQSVGSYVAIGEIWTERPVLQELPAPENADGISLLFATYMRTNEGAVTVRVTGKDSGAVYAESVFDAAAMADNSFVDIPFNVKPTVGDTLEISVTSDSEPGSAVTLWKTEEDSAPDCALLINDAEQEGDLVYRTYHKEFPLFGRRSVETGS